MNVALCVSILVLLIAVALLTMAMMNARAQIDELEDRVADLERRAERTRTIGAALARRIHGEKPPGG